MIYNVVLISALQQSNSVVHVYILFHFLLFYGFSQAIEYSSLCYRIGPCCLWWSFILFLLVFICLFFCILGYVGSWFSGQGLNPGPLQWKVGLLNHWTAVDVPVKMFLCAFFQHLFILISQSHWCYVSNCGCSVR